MLSMIRICGGRTQSEWSKTPSSVVLDDEAYDEDAIGEIKFDWEEGWTWRGRKTVDVDGRWDGGVWLVRSLALPMRRYETGVDTRVGPRRPGILSADSISRPILSSSSFTIALGRRVSASTLALGRVDGDPFQQVMTSGRRISAYLPVIAGISGRAPLMI